MRHLLIALCLAGPVAAETCPPAPDLTEPMAPLIDAVRAAKTEAAARPYIGQMWDLWAKAPDAKAQEILDRGIRRFRTSDLDGAVEAFDALVAYCPNYAEGYNQRAFVAFIRSDYATAIDDLDRALELSPLHIAAMSGRALTLMRLGRSLAAQSALREALDLNPWLPERRFLIEKPGVDL